MEDGDGRMEGWRGAGDLNEKAAEVDARRESVSRNLLAALGEYRCFSDGRETEDTPRPQLAK